MLAQSRLCIDVSNNNPIGASELLRVKPQLLIAKATEGDWFQDHTYAAHRSLAASNGIRFGSYLFLHPGSKGNEAEFFLEYAKPTKEDEIAVDVEVHDGFGMPVVAHRALTCLTYLKDKGFYPLLYCSASWWLELVNWEPKLKLFHVWEAQYPGRFERWVPELAAKRIKLLHGATVDLWQWTDRYQIGNKYYDASRIMTTQIGLAKYL